MLAELHISSLVVHSTPKRIERVAEAIAAIPGAEVHARSAAGKLVVTLETDTAQQMSAIVAEIQRTEGVLSAALVYQCVDSLDAMNEEMPDGYAQA
ncbi:chaperone NapD [Roseateles violae]|uniref:Chaperone NapD n=1 Tax=Roseateles violae TaxID=3058042 RepID=A0ABT8DPY6_9BURK|nr:chaperone NapD [Pelomonas sp. PFR6]MDN3919153.1 chaperone NapD [Pelomonas sp. PFR6]